VQLVPYEKETRANDKFSKKITLPMWHDGYAPTIIGSIDNFVQNTQMLYSMFKLIFYYMFIIFLRNYSPEAKTNEP
jgi:hypothetical protein